MADVYLREDVLSLLKNKHVLFVGDSNVRALYKDLVWLYRSNTLIDVGILKRRLELSFLGDTLLGRSDLTRGRDFFEHRVYEDKNIKIEFLFVTRCYSKNFETILSEIKDGRRKPPDVIYMNSCLWDVCRWGPNGVRDYKTNMVKLMKLLSLSLPATTLFIWGTALPTASTTSGGLIIKQIEFIQAALRIHVIEANKFTSSLVSSYGYDVLDFHHYMHYQIIRRSADGIHFLPPAVRFLTNLFLTHIALSWDIKLPERLKVNTSPLENEIKSAMSISSEKVDKMVQKMDDIANNLSCAVKTVSPLSKKKNNKKKKNNMMKTINNNSVIVVEQETLGRSEIKTPPIYEKAPRPVFSRIGPQVSCPVANETQKDFRLLSFNDFSHNSSIDQVYENCRQFNSQYNQNRENHHPTNAYNNRFSKYNQRNNQGSRMSSVVNIHNDPYNSVNYFSDEANYGLNYGTYYYPQTTYYNNQSNAEQLVRTLYNPEFWKDYLISAAIRIQGNDNNYNRGSGNGNQWSNQYTYNSGPMRARPKVGNRYWTPYERNGHY